MGEHWERASKEPFFEIVIGINRGNTFSQASELAANVAVFQTASPDDAHAGMARFFEEVNEISGSFQNFCEGVTRAVLERLSGLNLDQLGALDEITPSRKFSEMAIPVFCLLDEEVGEILP